MGDRRSQEDEHNAMERQCRTSDLGILWQGLGSLGERLAGVGERFDLLDEEICHDQQVYMDKFKALTKYFREYRDNALAK